jgi:CubicO group peptidase (beta-lactamase class C family)
MSDESSRMTTERHDGWLVGVPEQHRMSSAPLISMDDRVGTAHGANVHAIIVAREGVLVHERYFAGEDQIGREPPARVMFNATTKHNVNSATKSVVSLLVGIAIDRGWIMGLETPVFSYFPEYADLRTPEKDRINVRHLLTMSDGLEWHEFVPPFDSVMEMRRSVDPYRYILGRPVAIPAGRTFNYNSGSTALLGLILRKTSGKPIDDLAKEELFDRLGIDDTEWQRMPQGDPSAGGGLRLRPCDAAKIGQLVLNNGNWRGAQVVPAAWINESIRAQNKGPPSYLYGYQWWIGGSNVNGRVVGWAGAFGWGGQRLIVIPELEMTVFFAAWTPNDMAFPERVLLREHILPAVVA